MLCGIAVRAVTYDGVGGMRSVPQIFFGMSRLATLLLSLGPAKLVRHSWI
jgi:hypothetical protein